MSIIERAKSIQTLDNIPQELMKTLFFNNAIEERMMKTWEDSKGEILDSRIFAVQKLKLEIIKALRDMDPNVQMEKLALEKQAELALAMAKKRISKPVVKIW